ncbi:hypothetical protein CDD81_3056 [Ophiocordyceps australis]|uniref:Uncharacterized protein n=1 Tax=Ophiocordyceps australis TaxID=1399860 RepID=A0A2C5Y907_9HYPO|nr:hypothetical protein CDD81_3056 [Ophiocordyceps australis]
MRRFSCARKSQHSSYSANVNLSPSGENRHSEEVRFSQQEERYRRPGFQHEHYVKDERRPARSEFSESHIEIDTQRPQHASPIDIAERQYRERFRSRYQTTVDPPSPRSQYQSEGFETSEYTVDGESRRPSYHEEVKITEETVEPVHLDRAHQKSKMGYYDEDGHYHSFRHGIHKLADKIAHPHHGHREHVEIETGPRPRPGDSSESYMPNTVTIPCHHIRLGDFLMLQGRPCQVIRISTSPATGQYRYLGVDLFTKQLHEESSFISNPAPSVVVQTMLGPIFKQYRVLDIHDGHVVAMTETGDVKQGLPVIDQSNLWSRLHSAFESGRGSVRILVLNDSGRELAVDMKVIHGSRL